MLVMFSASTTSSIALSLKASSAFCNVEGTQIFFTPLRLNANIPTSVQPSGMVNCVSDVVPAKAYWPMLVMVEGRFTVVSF